MPRIFSVIDAAVAKGVLYGAYDNVLSTVGVSAMWSGVISANGKVSTVPTVVVDGNSATSTDPENLACPASHIVFYEAGAATKKLTEEEAVQRYVLLLSLLSRSGCDCVVALQTSFVNTAMRDV